MRTSACILLAATMVYGRLAPPARAQAAPALAGVSGVEAVSAPTSPVRLEVRLKAGQSHRFRITDDSILRAMLPNGGVRRTATHIDATFEMVVDRVNSDGAYVVRVRPVSQSLKVDDRDVPPTEANRAEVTATVGRDGRVSGISGITKKKSESAEVMDAQDFLETIFDKDAGYPARALAVGEGWKDQVESPIDESGSRITVNNSLMALDVVDGRQVARLLNVVAEPLQVPADENGVSMSGTIEGGGLTTVDLSTGLPIDGRDTIRLKVTVSAPKAESNEKLNVDSEAGIKIHIQALPPEAA